MKFHWVNSLPSSAKRARTLALFLRKARTKAVATTPLKKSVLRPSLQRPTRPAAAETSNEPQQTTTTDGGRLKASPLARKMAEENNLDITQIGGSGEGGRIVKRDIEEAMAQDSAAKPAPPAQAPATSTPTAPSASASSALADQPESQYEDQRVSQMRKTIANRLGESKFSAPHFYLTVPIDMENAIAFRQQLKSEDVKISFNDLVLKAVATSLRKHPAVNSSWLGDSIREHKVVNIGVAVAVPDGLVVPVVHNTDRKGMQEINAEVRELAGLAREKKLTPAQMQGNTFSVSNLGMFGIEEFTAIINPPDACILAVGGIMDTPVVKNGVVVPGKQMKVTLSCDHRVVDGATGSEFLQTLKYMLENPMRMLL